MNVGQWLRAELRGAVSHIHAELELCAPPPLIHYFDNWFRVGLAKAASVPALQEFIRPWRAMSYTFAVPRQSFAVANFLPLMENDFPRGVS